MTASNAAMGPGAANIASVRALVDSLVAGGLRSAVISPGSRSGPLAVALAERSDIRSFVVTDERSAAFFALGIARYDEVPPLLLCTSGTAAANFAAAVAEAAIAEVPLLVATADRPPEARGFGAPQTIRQADLFARHVRLGIDAAVPSSDGPPVAYYRALAAKALAAALGPTRGPVHLNLPFREPLMPTPLPPVAAPGGRGVTATRGEHRIAREKLDEMAARLARSERGILICGPTSRPRTFGPALAALARALDWPLFADPLSGLRERAAELGSLIEPHDLVLRSSALRAVLHPDLILRFGALPTSKALREAIAGWGAEQIVVTSAEEWPDPDWGASEVVIVDPTLAAADLARALTPRGASASRRASWLGSWRAAADEAVRAAAPLLIDPESGAEAWIASELCHSLPADAVLVVGNSMPIRDVDAFCTGLARGPSLFGNRGANGIDGVLSTAFGIAATSARPTAVLLGDLSFLHDAASLPLAIRHALPVLVVVVDNDGGGIFHSLPWADLGDTFERYFATPHGLDLERAGALAGAEHARAARPGELAPLVADWVERPRLMVVEASFDRLASQQARKDLIGATTKAVERWFRTRP